MSRFVQTNGIRLHIADTPGGSPPLVLVHGLTANCRAFDVVVGHLAPRLRVLAPDMRGRGASDKPDAGYTMGDHAADVIGLLDTLGLDRIVMGGHSFGGLLSLYMAANYADRVERVVVIDAAISAASERTRELIRPALARLEQSYPSFEAYLDLLRRAPYYHGWEWDPAVEQYYRADVLTAPDGSVRPCSHPHHIAAAADGVIAEPWREHLSRVERPVLMLHATGPYGPPGAPPILSAEQAAETRALLPHCDYAHIPGNHMTMLYGEGARAIAGAILAFLGT